MLDRRSHLKFPCSHGLVQINCNSLRPCHVYIKILMNGNSYSIIDNKPLTSLHMLYTSLDWELIVERNTLLFAPLRKKSREIDFDENWTFLKLKLMSAYDITEFLRTDPLRLNPPEYCVPKGGGVSPSCVQNNQTAVCYVKKYFWKKQNEW